MLNRKKSFGFERIFLCVTGVCILFILQSLFGTTHITGLSFFLTLVVVLSLSFTFPKDMGYNGKLFIGVLRFWTIVILIRGFQLQYDFFMDLFISPFYFMPFVFPFAIRYFTINKLKYIFKMLHYCNFLYLLFIALYLINGSNLKSEDVSFAEVGNKYLSYANFFLMFNYKLVSPKAKIVSLITFFTGLLLSILYARRGMVWTHACAGLITLIIYFVQSKMSVTGKLVYFVFTAILGVVFYGVFYYYQQTIFGKLMDRINADSRGEIVDDFNADMSTFDLAFGRGIGGSFHTRSNLEDSTIKQSERYGIETGYLDIVLRGGYVYLIVLLIIYIIVMRNGFYKSKNTISKAFAATVLLHILELYPSGNLAFNGRYLILWFGVVMCLNPKVLSMSDNDVLTLLNIKQPSSKNKVLI